MIHPKAVAEFLDRATDSHAWVKALDEKVLDAELARLDFRQADPKAKPLRKHQKACVLLGLAFPQFAFWLDMGTGKTRLTLELLNHWRRKGVNGVFLILSPSEQSVYTWQEQIARWGINVPVVALGNSPSAEKWTSIDEMETGFLLMTYPGLSWLVSRRMAVKGKKKMKQKMDPKLVRRLTKIVRGIVWDESTKLGNQGSLVFRICRKIAQTCDYRYALAGRPFGRDPTMIWSQQYLVDQGESLGDTLGLFRAAFFHEKRGHFGGFEYTFDEKMRDQLAQMMQHRSISYASSECQTLPAVTTIIEEILLPLDAAEYYKAAVKAVRDARGNYKQMKNIFLRMRQLSSGFIGYRDDETGERAQIVFPVNPKLDRLLELIDEVPLDRKFVVFHEFTHSGRTISAALDKMKIKHGWLWSGTKDSQAVQRRFDTDPKMRGMIINSKLGSMSLNMQVANYQFDFENPPGVIDKEQMDKRCFREGQLLPGFRYELTAKGTADQKILDFHAGGEDIFKALLRLPYGLG